MKCRICGSEQVVDHGKFTPYLDYETSVYGCKNCGSRFVRREESAYERLHADSQSSYAKHYRSASEARSILDAKGIEGYRRYLCEIPKYRRVINAVASIDKTKKVLEMGCSTGVLGAYFIERGDNYTGIDVSATAVNMANTRFGEYFYRPGEQPADNEGAYDAVYFVGTIGCVEDPLEFVRQALSQLKPGGILIFNAPNVEACEVFNDIWLSGTTPPDLVNLFSRNIWEANFGEQADVTVEVDAEQPEKVIRKVVRKLRFGTSVPRATSMLYASKPATTTDDNADNNTGKIRFGRTRGVMSRVYHAVVNNVLALAVGERYPSEFGQYVFMRKK